jgi:hypothetical protein
MKIPVIEGHPFEDRAPKPLRPGERVAMSPQAQMQARRDERRRAEQANRDRRGGGGGHARRDEPRRDEPRHADPRHGEPRRDPAAVGPPGPGAQRAPAGPGRAPRRRAASRRRWRAASPPAPLIDHSSARTPRTS